MLFSGLWQPGVLTKTLYKAGKCTVWCTDFSSAMLLSCLCGLHHVNPSGMAMDYYSIFILGLLPKISEKEEAQKLPSMFQVRYREQIICTWGIILPILYKTMNKSECLFWHWLIVILKTLHMYTESQVLLLESFQYP